MRRYVVFRVKAIEFLDIGALRQALNKGEVVPSTPVGRIPRDFADSLRTVQLSWFAIFIDKSKDGMDVIKLWKELFPKYKTQIEEAWARMEPAWHVVRRFRDKAGFHADKPSAFFKARREIIEQQEAVTAVVEEFGRLLSLLLNAEPTELPDLEEATEGLLAELEAKQGGRYKRDEFKRYLMLPNTSKANAMLP